ncbi:hypothetical protein Tco_0116603 [Tanacetum coccineum]
MSTYLKNMGGYKHSQLKGKSYDEIQKLFNKEMKRVNIFVAMDSEAQESSSKRAGDNLESNKSKKQKVDEHVEAKEVDDQEEGEMKKHMEILVDDEEIEIDVIPLATKLPVIVEYKIVKERKIGHCQLIRADGSSKRYSSMIQMLQNIDREDLETLWKRHFKTLSLDELRSPDFNLLSNQEYLEEEEEAEAMAETMEQYMRKTRTDYGSGVVRPKIDNKDQFELKGQFLEELRENTFEIMNTLRKGAIPTMTIEDTKKAIQEMAEYSQKWHNGTSRGRRTETSDGISAIQAQLKNLGREIKKVNEKVYDAQVGCEQCKGPHYTKDFPLKEEGKTLEEAYYTQFGGPFQGGGYRATAPGFYQRNNVNPSYQERRQSMEDTLSKFMNESAKRLEENSNLIKEI